MFHCNHCNVDVSTNTHICPLCGEKLVETSKENITQTFPKLKVSKINKPKVLKFLNILPISAISILVLINIFTFNGILWSMIVTVPILYLWIFSIWIIKNSNISGAKLVFLIFMAISVLIGIAIFGSNLYNTINLQWATTYCIPFIMCASILVLLGLLSHRKINSQDFIFPQFFQCVLCIAYSIVLLCGLSNGIIYPAIMLLSIASCSIAFELVYNWKKVKQEFERKFYF